MAKIVVLIAVVLLFGRVLRSQSISIHLSEESRGILRVDSSNWNEAWVELVGASPLAKPLRLKDFEVSNDGRLATLLSLDSIGVGMGTHLATSFVLDNSGSMFHSYDSLTSICDRFVDSLPSGGVFQAVLFDKEARSDSHLYTRRSSVFIAQTGFRNTIAPIRTFWHFFDTIRTGFTPLYDAITAAIANITARRDTGDSDRCDVLIVVTDGEDNASRITIERLREVVSAARVRLITISYRTERDPRLAWLIRHTRGEYFQAEDIPDLRELFRELGMWMITQYHIQYRFPSLTPSPGH